MRKLNSPKIKTEDVFDACVTDVRDADLQARLRKCRGLVLKSATAFGEKVVKAQLHTLVKEEDLGGLVTTQEMKKVYNERMVKKSSLGRPYYDMLLSAAPLGKCPLCNHGMVSTLDHHLPKSSFPSLAVTPVNLIPACRDCNTTKITQTPKQADEETLHPYFDDVENDRWLFSNVMPNSPATVIFFIDQPDWDSIKLNRLKSHFKTFNLYTLYSLQSATHLINIRHYLLNLYKAAGEDGVKKHLLESAESYSSVFKNSWQAAMYEALANSVWFCAGGFAV